MSGETHRRRELGEFLRARRRQLVRADVGLPVVKGRNALGLRREEVSYLSGVSATWYTWLEQGREIRPSRPPTATCCGWSSPTRTCAS